MSNYLGFDAFKQLCERAPFAYVKPYGIYHKGEVFWDKAIPRKPGSVVRFVDGPHGRLPVPDHPRHRRPLPLQRAARVLARKRPPGAARDGRVVGDTQPGRARGVYER